MKSQKITLLSIYIILIPFFFIYAEECKQSKNSTLAKKSNSANVKTICINNVSTWIYNNGISDINPSGEAGLEYPIGSNKTIGYCSGLVWGGKIDGVIRVGGSTYKTGWQPGRIFEDGTAQNPNDEMARVFRVRPDWETADLSKEANLEGVSIDKIRAAYEKDWNEWPVDLGAPYEDVDNNGSFDPSIDIPGYPGADQTLWYVVNDLDIQYTANLYGSTPVGIQMSVTVWAYNKAGSLGNTIFKKCELINRSESEIEDMYLSMWSDFDIGVGSSDLQGCDTLLDLTYSYNQPIIEDDWGVYAPSIGFVLLKEELTTHYVFLCGEKKYKDPDFGEYEGSIKFYDYMRGINYVGEKFYDPVAEKETKFILSGDPLTNSGWAGGFDCGNIQGSVAGPFILESGEKKEIVYAQVVAGSEGLFTANSIESLRKTAKFAKEFYNDNSTSETILGVPKINYEYTDQHVTIKFDNADNFEIENFDKDGYKFQGYEVYQLQGKFAALYEGKLVSTIDVNDGIIEITDTYWDYTQGKYVKGVVKKGTDRGIETSLFLESDPLTGRLFLPGERYYFALAAYAYNPNAEEGKKVIESEKLFFEYIPLPDDVELPYEFNEIVEAEHYNGNSTAKVEIEVYNPALVKGHEYSVTFNDSETWNLTNLTTNKILLQNQSNVYPYPEYKENFQPIEGFKIFVEGQFGYKFESKDYLLNRVDKIYEPVEGVIEYESSSIYNIIYSTYAWYRGIGITDVKQLNKDLELRFTGEYEEDSTDEIYKIKDGTGSVATLYEAVNYELGNHPMNPNPESSEAFIVRIPFEVWNIEDNRQLNVLLYDKGQSLDTKPFYAYGENEKAYFHIVETPYTEEVLNIADVEENISLYVFSFLSNWEKGDVITLETPNSIVPNEDEFRFTLKASPITEVENIGEIVSYELSQNYPNPFNPTTIISYQIPDNGLVKLQVFDVLGREITTLVNQQQNKGKYSIQFNASKLSSGIYFYRIEAGEFIQTNKMLLLK